MHLKFALRFLQWLCPQSLYESIEGDLLEQFEADLNPSDRSKRSDGYWRRRAKRRFIWNVICFMRPGILLRNKFSFQLNQIDMIRNYFILAYRHLLRSKVYSMINILGLAIGLTCFLYIIHYVQYERSYENFHQNADNIARVTLDIYKGNEFVVADCGMYARIGPLLKEELPEVIDYARLWLLGSRVVKAEERKFYEGRLYLADPSVFKLFSFNILQGRPALSDPLQVVITKTIAQKYFGQLEVVGKLMEIENKLFTITAVVDDVPANSHLKFDLLLSHSSASKFWEYDENGYEGNNEFTYLLMKPPVDMAEFNKKLRLLSIKLKDKIGDDRLVAQSLKDIHLYSNKTFEAEPNGNAQAIYFLMAVGIFILCIALVNYINLSTARAMERAREVGIRKVMGSLRRQLVFQFLSESILVTLIASIIAVGSLYLGQPAFIRLTGKELPMILQSREFWYLFLCLLFFGSLLAGFYPAVVLSSFQPVMVLKGRLHSTSHGQWLRKGLVVFQFAATIILMVCVFTVYLQIDFLQKQRLGMNIEQTLVLRSPKIDSVELYGLKVQALRNELLQRPFVHKMTQSGTLPGLSLNELTTTGNVLRPGQEKNDKGYLYYINAFDENFIPQLQMELVAGRNFYKEEQGVLIINEEALYALGFKNAGEAVGSKLLFYDNEMTVVGVLKNFSHRSPKEKYLPMVFWCDRVADYFLVQLNQGSTDESIEEVHKAWNKIFPDTPFDYFFLDEKYKEQYKSDQQFGSLIGLFSILAALIACLGLFGLSSFTIIQRTKEVGIRKVLGASATQIVQLLSRDFIKLVLIAGVIAIPFGYFVMNEWLSGYATRIQLNAWIFTIPSVIVLLIALFTVSFQTIKAAQSNPVNTLKSE